MDINYINALLQEGKSVKDVRETLGVSEKKFQKEIKALGYKYNQKERCYISAYKPITEVLDKEPTKDIIVTTKPTTKEATSMTTLTTTQSTTINYLADNLDVLKQLLENYKKSTPNDDKGIYINLVSDKHLNPKPKSLRINEFVWREWQEFTKDLTFSKSDLISQALLEFIKNHS